MVVKQQWKQALVLPGVVSVSLQAFASSIKKLFAKIKFLKTGVFERIPLIIF
jgi:hypothetical protein